MEDFRRLGVYCGSGLGHRPDYREAAAALGQAMVDHDLELVYGGGDIGLMGILANAVLDGGGRVTGVITRQLVDKEVAHRGITDLQIVADMPARKRRMFELSDAFVAMPGGIGTMEELFEVLSWAGLGLHAKPIGLLNVGGYFDGLHEFLSHAVAEGFIKPRYQNLMTNHSEPVGLLEELRRRRP